MIGVAGAIDALMSGTYTVTRYTKGSYVNGRFVPGTTSTFTIDASIQPAGAEDVMRLPEGIRDRKAIAIYTRTTLQHAKQDAATSDRIVWQGEVFEMSSIDEWDETAAYNKAIATKIQEQAAVPPAAPTVDAPGSQPHGTVIVTGTCELGTVTVRVYFDTDQVAEVEPNVTTWTASVDDVDTGIYSVTARAVDIGGISPASTAKTLTVT